MKKIALFILTVALGALTLTALTACADPVVPGRAWADKETLSYVAYSVNDTEKQNPLFTMTTVMENLPKGSYALSTAPDRTFNMGESSRRYTVTATDGAGKRILYSESLMNSFVSVASHKEVDFNGKKYSYDTEVSGKYLNYDLTVGEENFKDSINVGDKYIDNELIYSYIRTYSSAESNLSSSIYLVDVPNRRLTYVNYRTTGTGESTLSHYAAEPDKKIKSARVEISRASSPVGSPIRVDYSLSTEGNFTFASQSSNSESVRIPVQIIENDIIYYLTAVSVD